MAIEVLENVSDKESARRLLCTSHGNFSQLGADQSDPLQKKCSLLEVKCEHS